MRARGFCASLCGSVGACCPAIAPLLFGLLLMSVPASPSFCTSSSVRASNPLLAGLDNISMTGPPDFDVKCRLTANTVYIIGMSFIMASMVVAFVIGGAGACRRL